MQGGKWRKRKLFESGGLSGEESGGRERCGELEGGAGRRVGKWVLGGGGWSREIGGMGMCREVEGITEKIGRREWCREMEGGAGRRVEEGEGVGRLRVEQEAWSKEKD